MSGHKTYHLYYHPAVKDDISGFPKNIRQMLKKSIEGRLLTDPLHYGDPLKKSLAGYRKLRVGDYRIIYKLEKNTIKTLKIGHRKEIYSQAHRRIE